MNLRTSFRSKLLLLTIVPLAVAQIVTLIAVMRTVQADVDGRARDSLMIGGEVVTQFLTDRAEQLRTSVEVIASDFGLKEAAATGDAATIRSVLLNHSQRVGADVAFLLDLDGNEVVSTANNAGNINRNFVDLVNDTSLRQAAQSTLSIGSETYHVFTVSLHAPVQIGWVVLGFRIDSRLAERISSLTGVHVSIVANDAGQPRHIATASNVNNSLDVTPTEFSSNAPLNSVYMVTNSGVDQLTIAVPFSNDSKRVVVALQRSMRDAMLPYTDARRGLIAFAAALLVFVAIAAAYVSGSIAKPLRVLTDAARQMMSGKYDTIVGVSSNDEFGELATSFNAMQTAISDREERISHQALHDSLTDLPNRSNILRSLSDAIRKSQESRSKISVLSIRLLRMTAISSTLGHKASDEVISLAAKHLRVNLDPGEILGHVGTNEFVLLLPDCDADNALTYADRIESIFGAGVTLDRINITLQTEIGVSEYPRHGEDAAELLRNASIARSEAEASHERVRVYEEGRQDHYVRQLRIVNDLRSALKKDEVCLHFQPKVSLFDGKPCGAEALVRWQHPELGLLAPDDFIPAAEQAGTIVHLTRHVLSRAIRYCHEWDERGFSLQMSVNLSARDLQDEYLPYYVLQILKEHHVTANRLTLEITENTVMQDINHAIAVLECLRDIGVRISIDDFGTGHSSLAQLRNIPLHELKIDKSFIMDMLGDDMNEAIVRTVIELSHNMQLDVVAEGVEDEDTLRKLCGLGCEQAQGYFLSKPLPSEEFLAWLTSYEPVIYQERRKKSRVFADSA
ncbi:MAG: diguanylate cyclase (GGDEF)-like protein [Woeseiaceae bacterium]|jgi:diguanylate cyclase (GGDEF)-like protein